MDEMFKGDVPSQRAVARGEDCVNESSLSSPTLLTQVN